MNATQNTAAQTIVDFAELHGFTTTAAANALNLGSAAAQAARELVGKLDASIALRIHNYNRGRQVDPVVAVVVDKPVRKMGIVTRAKIGGHSVTAILRWMGTQDWNAADATRALDNLSDGVVSTTTVRLQLKAGANGKRGPAADVNASLARRLRNAAK